MTNLYASHYLNIYRGKKRGGSILFHGITGAIDEVDPKLGALLKRYQKSGEVISDDVTDDILFFLSQRGHVTPQSAEEERGSFKKFVENLHAKKCAQTADSGFLMVVPSYWCNLACSYCFQNQMRETEGRDAITVMTKKTVHLIFNDLLNNLFPSVKRQSKIHIDLYGGEPFLDRNRKALEEIFRYTTLYQMSVGAISNASQLGGFIDYFGQQPGHVNELQISFDGDKLAHDKSRITHYGKGTFDDIIANIHLLIERGTKINLRVNTSKDNFTSLPILWKQLKNEEITTHPLVNTYAAAIHSHYDQVTGKELFSPAVLSIFMEKEKLPIGSPLRRNLNRLGHLFRSQGHIPLDRTHFCMQNKPNAFLIDHRRDIYGCYEEAGNRVLRIGEFDDRGVATMNSRYQSYQSRHVAAYEPCASCSVALTCGGGCAVAARGKDFIGSIFTNYCDSQKELVAMAIQKLFAEDISSHDKLNAVENRWSENYPHV